jgi:hypothetical protein
MLRIGEGEETTALTSTSLSEQGYKEEDLREWILESPHSILGEDILIIGREVQVQGIGDGIDLLGIDRDGNVVVIELKKGSLTGNVDFQSLKYAAYASYWEWGQLSDQFEKFAESKWGRELYEEDVDFNEKLESFCNDEYELNGNQRILLVGEGIRERLDLVVRWLSDREVEISVLEVEMLADGDQLYLDTEQIIPIPEDTVSGVKPDTSKDPWKDDGERWHLEEKLNDDAAELLQEVVDALGNLDSLEGPHWGQKQYVSFKQNRKNRVILRTRTEVFKVEIYDIPVEDIDIEALADAVGVSVEDVKADAEDLRGGRPGVQITCRGGAAIDTERLAEEVEKYLATKEGIE